MSKLEELKKQLEAENTGKEFFQKKCVIIHGDSETENRFSDGVLAICDKKIAAIEAQIAEEKKPELRHGRCGIMSSGRPYITIGNGVGAVAYYENGSQHPIGKLQDVKSDTSTGAYACFEAFDEIKALQEDVTEFEMAEKDKSSSHYDLAIEQHKCAELGSFTQLMLNGPEGEYGAFNFSIQEFELFTMNCRKVLSTMKRQERK
jgi:hypothetical protein